MSEGENRRNDWAACACASFCHGKVVLLPRLPAVHAIDSYLYLLHQLGPFYFLLFVCTSSLLLLSLILNRATYEVHLYR